MKRKRRCHPISLFEGICGYHCLIFAYYLYLPTHWKTAEKVIGFYIYFFSWVLNFNIKLKWLLSLTMLTPILTKSHPWSSSILTILHFSARYDISYYSWRLRMIYFQVPLEIHVLFGFSSMWQFFYKLP